jgi:hypothetical protein
MVLVSCVHPVGTADRTVSHQAVYTGTSPTGYIPPGNTIQLRVKEAIRTDVESEGKSYTAELAADLVGGNRNIVAPAGSSARLVVIKYTEGGPTTKGQVQLALGSVVANGRTVEVHSARGPAGPLGTVVSAVPAGGGAPVEAVTSGPELRVPADTILTFQTNEPVYLGAPPA